MLGYNIETILFIMYLIMNCSLVGTSSARSSEVCAVTPSSGRLHAAYFEPRPTVLATIMDRARVWTQRVGDPLPYT